MTSFLLLYQALTALKNLPTVNTSYSQHTQRILKVVMHDILAQYTFLTTTGVDFMQIDFKNIAPGFDLSCKISKGYLKLQGQL